MCILQAVRALTQAGVVPARIALGVPLYARGVRDPQRVRTYGEIVAAAAAERADLAALDLAADATRDGLAYNGVATVRAKTQWARQLGARARLGGPGHWRARVP